MTGHRVHVSPLLVMTGVYHQQVLSLYKQILRLARSWRSIKGIKEETIAEKKYIVEEAERLFKKNKYETSEENIKDHIKEAETRLGLAQHYGIPYPRMMNYPQNVLPPNSHSKFKKDERILSQATPIYLKSYKDDSKPSR